MNRVSNYIQSRFSFFYGWIIVFLGGLGLFFSGPGQTYVNAVFIDSYIDEFGWSRSLVSGIYSGATLLSGSLLFLIGRAVDKYGQRRMSLIIGVMLAVACFWNSLVFMPAMLFVGFFMLRFFGQGSMTLVPNTLVPQWFIEKRGRALSFMAIGGFLSSALFPPLTAWLIGAFSWEVAFRILGATILLIFVPLVFLFMKNRPEDMGLKPDNTVRQLREDGTVIEDENPNDISWTLKEAMKTRQFWMILFCVSIPALVNTGITFHLVSIFTEGGLGRGTAAFILSLMAIIGFPITMVSGFILERVKVNVVLSVSFLGQLAFVIILIYTESYWMAILFGVVWGMVNGLERITLSIIWPDYFGRKHLGSIKGLAMTTMVIGSAFGPLPYGFAYDLFGGYTEILLLTMVFPILGFIFALISPKPEKA
ncbi:MFS transporter [Pseudalkalibacillus salsuginis]|uniref:MFS transporter n=1 Tax=Pseudalkalibacillus salsuginis TaxID=2910972 RepID=UPI001F46305E|nr:MFS transporter [Pseudalkalibacillus salsuginis]MCF6409951.1 MFS transporter [Pseudalkalibacillus salsuginis]